MKHSRTDEDRKSSDGNGKEGTEEGLYSKKRGGRRDKTGLWVQSGVSTEAKDECDNKESRSVCFHGVSFKREGPLENCMEHVGGVMKAPSRRGHSTRLR